ncbi:hypothetical protein VP1G_11193 [Cytospora mali]|uniref:Uncharacterized protein n=1 Tax=Cytospora mali TaxID=578113 RepID=A0A194VBD6_CYTMA|nr:hypothetical protein VP1G_11193 [Valsa mali var. pyri (nom. inval.)]
MSPGAPVTFEMPSTSHAPFFPSPMNCPYPCEDISSPPPPPSDFFDYMDCAPASSPPSPPPAPRLSNLTTPTTFSRVTTNHTGSTFQETEVSTPEEAGMDVFVREESRPASRGAPEYDNAQANQ